jgi:hypothetical protein
MQANPTLMDQNAQRNCISIGFPLVLVYRFPVELTIHVVTSIFRAVWALSNVYLHYLAVYIIRIFRPFLLVPAFIVCRRIAAKEANRMVAWDNSSPTNGMSRRCFTV